jgi:hypothetical protein
VADRMAKAFAWQNRCAEPINNGVLHTTEV